MQTTEEMSLTEGERADFLHALRAPRGRYEARRAAQLSGVPERTIYHWALQGIVVPDHMDGRPKAWSYRDLVYLRLTAFLRGHRVDLRDAAALVAKLRADFVDQKLEIQTTVSAAQGAYALGAGMRVDELTGQGAFDNMVDLVGTFNVAAALEESAPQRRYWGPHLVRPSSRVSISPWVMSGEPVIKGSRIATVSLLRLHTDRGLSAVDIANLYPTVEAGDVQDALELEQRLRQAA